MAAAKGEHKGSCPRLGGQMAELSTPCSHSARRNSSDRPGGQRRELVHGLRAQQGHTGGDVPVGPDEPRARTRLPVGRGEVPAVSRTTVVPLIRRVGPATTTWTEVGQARREARTAAAVVIATSS